MPRTAPAFTRTMQIGIVVPNLEAAIGNYEGVFGIGPWDIMEIGPEIGSDVRVHGKPAAWKSRIATTMVGGVMWELIQPLDDNDMFGRFLAERGGVGGIHHVAVHTPDFKGVVQAEAERGNRPIMSGTFMGIDIQYLDTERELGVILEVFSGMP